MTTWFLSSGKPRSPRPRALAWTVGHVGGRPASVRGERRDQRLACLSSSNGRPTNRLLSVPRPLLVRSARPRPGMSRVLCPRMS